MEHSQSDGPSPSDSVSQVFTESTFPISNSPLPPPSLASAVSTALSSPSIPSEPKDRKDKSRTSWTAQHFWFTALDRKWAKNGHSKNDRLVVCKRCSWSTSDSALHGSTSNLVFHLRTRHQIGPGSSTPSLSRTPTLDHYLQPEKARLTVEQALLQWIVQTRQPFTAVEHPAFLRLVIFAVIGHWITPEFEKREVLLDFTELRGTHSGENMAEVLWNTVQELEIAHKLLTITGDNAGNNSTLCDALYAIMCKEYDDEDEEFRIKPLMRFHGRRSFIRCLAHVINLICKEFLNYLGAGSAKEAKRTSMKVFRTTSRSHKHLRAKAPSSRFVSSCTGLPEVRSAVKNGGGSPL